MKCSNPPCKTSSAVCPNDFPFSFQNGESCCSAPLEKEHPEFVEDGQSCFGRMMSWDSSCCKDDIPYQCTNPPCRDAAIANQAKIDYYYDHLPFDENEKFFQEDVFLVKKGWHAEQYLEKHLSRSKREVEDKMIISTDHQNAMLTNTVAALKSGIMRKGLDIRSDELGKDRRETKKENKRIIISESNESMKPERTMILQDKNGTSSYDTITALRKALRDSYKCKDEKCKKYSKDFTKGRQVDIPICLNPPCSYPRGFDKNYDEMIPKISVEKDDSTNIWIRNPSENSNANFWDPKFLILIIVGVIFVSCVCCCGCCCAGREISKYFARKEKRKEKDKKKEEFYLTHKDNYLEREQRLHKEMMANTTMTTLCASGDEGFGSRFDFHKDVPPPENQMMTDRQVIAYNTEGKRIMRSSTLKPHSKGTNYKVHTLARGSGIQKPHPDFYRSNPGLHKLTIDKRCQSEYIINGTGLNKTKKMIRKKEWENVRHNEARQSNVDDIHYEEFTRTLQKSDRRKFQSSSNLDSEGNQDILVGESGPSASINKSEHSSIPSDLTSNPSSIQGYNSLLRNDIVLEENESYEIATAISSPDSVRNVIPSKSIERRLPPLPPAPQNKPSIFELRQKASELKQVLAKDRQNR